MDNPNRSSSYQQLDEDFTCPICYQNSTENTEIEGCRHSFCTRCLKTFLNDKISSAKVAQIKCPNEKCENTLTRSFLETIIPSEMREKYNKFKNREELSRNALVKFCPQPDCEGYDIGGHKKYKLTCSLCKQKFCFMCNEHWHGKGKCKNKINVEFEKYVRDKHVKFCPKCGKRVEKEEGGCLNMICICGFQWCWRCGKDPMIKYHWFKCYWGSSIAEMRWIIIIGMFLSPIIAPISAMVFLAIYLSSDNTHRNGKLYKYRYWLYFMLLFFSIPVEIVVIMVFIYRLVLKCKHYSSGNNGCTVRWILAPLIAIIGFLVLYPLFILFLALGPIFGIICLSIKLCSPRKKQKIQERSNYPHTFI